MEDGSGSDSCNDLFFLRFPIFMILSWLKPRFYNSASRDAGAKSHTHFDIKYIYVTLLYSSATVSIKKNESTRVFFFSCCAAREKWVGCWATVRPYAMLLTIIYRQKKAARMWNKGSFIIIYFIPFRYDCYTYTYSSLVQRVEADDPRNVRLSCDSYHPTLFSFFPYFQALFRLHHKVIGYFVSCCPLKICAWIVFIFFLILKREKKGPPLSELRIFHYAHLFLFIYFFFDSSNFNEDFSSISDDGK